jgi:hypothetical protein
MANSSTKQRYISTSIWDDDWFADLDPDAKLLYFYLLTNEKTNVAGVYQISITRIARDTGMDKGLITSLFGDFEACQKVYYRASYVVLPNAPKHQKYETRGKIKAAIIAVLESLPEELIQDFLSNDIPYQFDLSLLDQQADRVSYHTESYDDVSIPNDTVDSNLDSDSDSDSDSDPEKESPVSREADPGDFKRLHDDFFRIAGKVIPPGSHQVARMLLSKFPYDVVWYEIERAIAKNIRDPMRYVHSYMSKPGYDPPEAVPKCEMGLSQPPPERGIEDPVMAAWADWQSGVISEEEYQRILKEHLGDRPHEQ